MARTTPSVSAATLADIAPAAAACPAASKVAALIVPHTTEAGTHADAAFCDTTAALLAAHAANVRRLVDAA